VQIFPIELDEYICALSWAALIIQGKIYWHDDEKGAGKHYRGT
jgi:hypothetical protein